MPDQFPPVDGQTTIGSLLWHAPDGAFILRAERETRFLREDDADTVEVVVWRVRFPSLDLGENHRQYKAGPLESGWMDLDGCGDDLAAVQHGLEQLGAALIRFADRMHVARLSVLGELGDIPAIARARARDNAEAADPS